MMDNGKVLNFVAAPAKRLSIGEEINAMSEKEYCNYRGVADFMSEIPTAENSEVNFKALSCNLSNSSLATLSEPTMNVDALINLSRFLENSQSSANFPDVSVLPDVLRDVGKFVNERKQMKYNHERFKKTLVFIEGN